MYTVLFQNISGERRPIGVANDMRMCYKIIDGFLEEKNYQSYYTKSWQTDDKTIKIDVGSWSEFFFITSDKTLDITKDFEG